MGGTPITASSAYNALGRRESDILSELAAGRSGLRPWDDGSGPSRHYGRAPDPPALPEPFAAFDCRAGRILAAALADLVGPVAVARNRWGSHRVAIVLGTHAPDIGWLRSDREHPADQATLHARGAQGSMLLARDALELRGPAYCVAAEGAAGAAAIASAHRLIKAGLADAVVAGGVGALSSIAVRAFEDRRLLSADPAKPLSAARAGASLGEGAALVLLERHGDAFAELLGWGEAQDPSAQAQAPRVAMERALQRAAVDPNAVGFVHLQGLGTITHDFAEARAVRECFGTTMPVTSLSGALGLVLGAEGAMDFVVAAAALRDGFIPGTVGCEPLDPTLSVTASAARRDLDHDYALVHAASLGGRSIALVLGART